MIDGSAMSTASNTSVTDNFKPYYKYHRYLNRSDVDGVGDILVTNSDRYTGDYTIIRQSTNITLQSLNAINEFLNKPVNELPPPPPPPPPQTILIKELPGLQIISGLLSPTLQQQLVYDTINEYLPPKEHLTNLDLHYDLPRPLNIFDTNNTHDIPHKSPDKPPLQMSLLRSKKLRWVTLGGQYNWTTKEYPSTIPGTEGFPHFPPRLSKLLNNLFNINSQAAIINFYSPGDILSPHQDIAEFTKADLISISLGLDCIFYIGKTRDSKPLPILLKSGDIVVMGGESRFAYHGVGKVFEGSCPDYLINYKGFKNELYKLWIENKRINMNVRQMMN